MKIRFSTISHNWNNYWFEKNLLLSASILRICISLSVLLILIHSDYGDYTPLLDKSRASAYEPIGLLQLLGTQLPSPVLFNCIRIVAFASTALLILGAFTRIMKFISVISSLMIVSILFSWGGDWSHGQNIPLLMHIAMLFAPSQMYFSIDKWIFKNKKQSWFMTPQNNGWGVYLAMFAAVIMFSNAGYSKFMANTHLAWVFSDNLRNYLIQQYLVIFQKPIPFYLNWIVNNEYGYKGLALANIISQLGISISIFFIKRPIIRLLFGIIFLLESLGLYFVMGYENLPWIPLTVAFVDWEWISSKFKSPFSIVPNLPENFYSKNYKLTGTAIIVVYLGVYCITAFDRGPGWQKEFKPYPFSGFSMFSFIFCNPPYDEHQPVKYMGNEFIFNVKSKDSIYLDSLRNALAYVYYRYNNTELYDTAYLHEILNHPLILIRRNTNVDTIVSIEWYKLINQSPAYPQKPKLSIIFKGLIGKIDGVGNFKTLTAQCVRSDKNDVCLKLNAAGYKKYTITAVDGILNNNFIKYNFPFQVCGDTLHVTNTPFEQCRFFITIANQDKTIDRYMTGNCEALIQ